MASKGRFDVNNMTDVEVVSDAARRVLALGWLYGCEPTAPLVERDPEAIWYVWAPSIREPLGDVVDKDLAKRINRNGSDLLVAYLKKGGKLRKARVLGPTKLVGIGFHLVGGGYYLRMVFWRVTGG